MLDTPEMVTGWCLDSPHDRISYDDDNPNIQKQFVTAVHTMWKQQQLLLKCAFTVCITQQNKLQILCWEVRFSTTPVSYTHLTLMYIVCTSTITF